MTTQRRRGSDASGSVPDTSETGSSGDDGTKNNDTNAPHRKPDLVVDNHPMSIPSSWTGCRLVDDSLHMLQQLILIWWNVLTSIILFFWPKHSLGSSGDDGTKNNDTVGKGHTSVKNSEKISPDDIKHQRECLSCLAGSAALVLARHLTAHLSLTWEGSGCPSPSQLCLMCD